MSGRKSNYAYRATLRQIADLVHFLWAFLKKFKWPLIVSIFIALILCTAIFAHFLVPYVFGSHCVNDVCAEGICAKGLCGESLCVKYFYFFGDDICLDKSINIADATGAIAKALGAGATTIAVIVALFRDQIFSVISRPKLVLEIVDRDGFIWERPEPRKKCFSDDGIIKEKWYHVRAKNLNKFSPAHETHVVISKIDGHPDFIDYYDEQPLALRYNGCNKDGGHTIAHRRSYDLCVVTQYGYDDYYLKMAPVRDPRRCKYKTGVKLESHLILNVTLSAWAIEAESESN